MKRHFYLILILTAQVLWPFITFGQDIDSCCHIFEVHETSMGYSGNCIPDSNGDWLFYKNMNTYIPYMNLAEPLSNSPIKTIEININIIQKDDSSGNFENNQSTINRFRNVITYETHFFQTMHHLIKSIGFRSCQIMIRELDFQ